MTNYSLSRRQVLLAGLAMPWLAGCATLRPGLAQQWLRPTAPFDMPAIGVPDFAASRRFSITDFGAVQDSQQQASAAIAQAIAAAHAAGSGVVVIPPGVWLTGKIHLKSNVNLHVAKGATLLFSDRPADYLPAVLPTWEGLECYNYSPIS